MSNRYAHLLTGASRDLDTVCCIEVDDINSTVSSSTFFDQMIPVVFDSKLDGNEIIAYKTGASRSTVKRKFKSLNRNFFLECENHSLEGIEVYSGSYDNSEVGATWNPLQYVGMWRHGRIFSAFAYSMDWSVDRLSFERLASFAGLFEFASSHCFEYPIVFSPLAYFHGLSFSPSHKRYGNFATQDAERIANWNSHCYRGNRPSDGFLREIHSLNLVGLSHKEKVFSGTDQTNLQLSVVGDRVLVTVEDLSAVQHDLDRDRVLLSAFAS